jgi:GNAT superfamily N-acetyltransferase
MNITIRKAEAADVSAMFALVKELAEYEKALNEVSVTAETMLRDGLSEESLYNAIVAIADHKVIGMAVYYTAYSTWKGKIIYLDDLVVTASYRRFGVGKMLFDELIRIVNQTGANQLRWHVLNWNESAIEFYRKYNASLDDEWITCKLTKEQLEKQNQD